MKIVSVRGLQKRPRQCVDDAQADRVVVTRHGKPAAVLVGVEGSDWETVVRQTDPTFWRLVRARRRQPTISFPELRSRLNYYSEESSRGAKVSTRRGR